jgi:hypothetical protein
VARVYEQRGFLEVNLDFGNLQRSILEKDSSSGGE